MVLDTILLRGVVCLECCGSRPELAGWKRKRPCDAQLAELEIRDFVGKSAPC